MLDVRQGELCWVVGTCYMEMALKPNILDDISKDHWISAVPPREKYKSPNGDDLTMLEDESGRLRLIGAPLAGQNLVTGCIIAAMGTENANGVFEVVDVKVPDLAPQPGRWELSGVPDQAELEGERKAKKQKLEDEDEDMMDASTVPPGNGSKIAIVSGLDITGRPALNIDLLMEYLLGEALDPSQQQHTSTISRLIIAGNSISLDDITPNSHLSKVAVSKKHKKYGYDASAYNPGPSKQFDDFLAGILPSIPVTLIPGASDPANVSLPQQPIHSAMFPRARAYGQPPLPVGEEENYEAPREPGWFDTVTNPWEGEVEGWRVVAAGGQNVDDVLKYVDSDSRTEMMEKLCRWRCVAPTAPDTLWSYPFQDDDPFVMNECPHLFIVGNQPAFETEVIEGPEGQLCRLLAIPKFSETGEIVIVDSETLDVKRVQIDIFPDTK